MKLWEGRTARLLALTLAVTLGLGWGVSRLMKGGAGKSTLGIVKREDLVQRVTVAGTVIPQKKTIITPPYNGYVRRMFVRVGDHVKAGDPVVSVAQSLLTHDDQVFPLRAPIEGTVVQVLKSEGEYVEQNTQNAIVRVDDLKHLLVECNAPEIEIQKLKIGQEVVIKAQAILNRTYKGRIQVMSLAAKEQANTWEKSRVEFPIRIEVLDADESLKPGMSVIVDIVAAKFEKVLTLRHEYIQKNVNRYFAVAVDGSKKPIEVGAQNEEAFEVRSGLSEGARVRQVDFLETLSSPDEGGTGGS
jgi:HlyD family secretion protein